MYFRDEYNNEQLIQSIGDIQRRANLRVQTGKALRKIIVANGFEVNRSKVRLQVSWQHQEVTGLTTNRFPNVSRRYVRQIRAMLHAWEKYGLQSAQSEYHEKYSNNRVTEANQPSNFRRVLIGKVEFVKMVRGKDDPVYIKLWNHLVSLDSSIGEPRTLAIPQPNFEPGLSLTARIYTEGKTDQKHLKAALASLKQKGLFRSLELSFDDQT